MSKGNGVSAAFPKIVNEQTTVDSLPVDRFVPFRHHLLVEVLPPRAKIGNIEIPDAFQERQALAWVRRINPADDGGPFGSGDLILFAPSAGADIRLEGKDMKILQYHSQEEGDILGHWPAGIDTSA